MEAVALAGLIVLLVCAFLLIQDNRRRKSRRPVRQPARPIDRAANGVSYPGGERRRGERRKINVPVAVERRVAERRGNPRYRAG
jgi:hypothetical protein